MLWRRTLESSKNCTESYWDKEWKNRLEIIDGKGMFTCNWTKFNILYKLLKGMNLNGQRKLEIGCGGGTLTRKLKYDNYTGIDLSPVAIEYASKFCLDGNKYIVGDVRDFETKEKFDVFMAFDALEHMELDDLLIKKIRDLSKKSSIFIGNIPLQNFTQHEDKVEHEITHELLVEFLRKCYFPTVSTITHYTRGIEKTEEAKIVYLPFLFFVAERGLL